MSYIHTIDLIKNDNLEEFKKNYEFSMSIIYSVLRYNAIKIFIYMIDNNKSELFTIFHDTFVDNLCNYGNLEIFKLYLESKFEEKLKELKYESPDDYEPVNTTTKDISIEPMILEKIVFAKNKEFLTYLSFTYKLDENMLNSIEKMYQIVNLSNKMWRDILFKLDLIKQTRIYTVVNAKKNYLKRTKKFLDEELKKTSYDVNSIIIEFL